VSSLPSLLRQSRPHAPLQPRPGAYAAPPQTYAAPPQTCVHSHRRAQASTHSAHTRGRGVVGQLKNQLKQVRTSDDIIRQLQASPPLAGSCKASRDAPPIPLPAPPEPPLTQCHASARSRECSSALTVLEPLVQQPHRPRCTPVHALRPYAGTPNTSCSTDRQTVCRRSAFSARAMICGASSRRCARRTLARSSRRTSSAS
jgi:hypothetical protein